MSLIYKVLNITVAPYGKGLERKEEKEGKGKEGRIRGIRA